MRRVGALGRVGERFRVAVRGAAADVGRQREQLGDQGRARGQGERRIANPGASIWRQWRR